MRTLGSVRLTKNTKKEIWVEEDLQRVQNRCLNVIGLPRDTVESLVTRRQNLTRKELKRILQSDAHPCKRFLEKPVDHGHNLRSCKTNPAHLRMPVSRTVRRKQSFIPRDIVKSILQEVVSKTWGRDLGLSFFKDLGLGLRLLSTLTTFFQKR